MNIRSSPQIQTTLGLLAGRFEAGVAVFRGIPYAAPPTGNRRWQPPQPASSWSGLRQAVQFGLSAPQNPSNAARFREFVVEEPQSEDCLYLNIWTPGLDMAHRPVMVWIHGGVFSMGSGSQDVFDGSLLAANQNVVVVTLNYRLGCLGFMNLKEITHGRIPATGNEGLMDQIAALHWIQDNIAGCGGDPANITLFGESAGGASIECLLCMPAAHDLFHKAILQSNMHQFVSLPEASASSLQVLRELGIPPDQALKLLEIPVELLLSVQKKLSAGGIGRRLSIFPVVDGLDLPLHPAAAFRAGKEAALPLIIGYNREETRLFMALHPDKPVDEGQLIKAVHKLFPDREPLEIIKSYRAALIEKAESPSPARILTAIQTDLNFRLPAVDLLNSRCRHHPAAFAYQFNWQSPALGGILGACHGMEIGFIFGHYDDKFGGSGPQADRLSRQMQEAWAAFARTGIPSAPAMGDWPSYCPDHFLKMIG